MDDSGDPGFKVSKGSSKIFVIGMVIFDDPLEAEEAALRIKKFRRELRLSDAFEFKFNKCRKDFRCRFLETVKASHFRVRAIVMQKNRIYGKELRASKESFYNYAIKTVLKYHGGTVKDARLRIDGRGDRKFKRALTAYLRRELNLQKALKDKVIQDLRFVDSKRNVLIQLADMVTGSINRKYSSDKSDSAIYLDIISNRIEDIWEFGR